LANIALDGMSEALGIDYQLDAKWHKTSKRLLVRYADDFVVFCETKEDAEQAKGDLKGWLTVRGLQLSEEKTRIAHLMEGFDFLGYNVRHYRVNNTRTGYKLLIKPSKEAVKELQKKLKETWKAYTGKPLNEVLDKLNPIIRGWANYHRINVASQVFSYLDHWMFRHEIKWAKRKHRSKGWKWIKQRYWGRLNKKMNNNWVFGDKHTGRYLLMFSWHNIRRHVLVRRDASPDDPELRTYWTKRNAKHSHELSPGKQKISRRQNHVCTRCGETLYNGEDLHEHHVVRPKDGGTDTYDNYELVHVECHKQITSMQLHAERACLSRVR
jgi:RNA-directed DNA polymerase